MQTPGGRPGKGGMVTGRIEPCIILSDKINSHISLSLELK